jgi:hypothetical protein
MLHAYQLTLGSQLRTRTADNNSYIAPTPMLLHKRFVFPAQIHMPEPLRIYREDISCIWFVKGPRRLLVQRLL